MENTSENKLDLLDEEIPELLEKIEENDDFIFETDSYALQNNKDYQVLLRTLVKLQAQRIYTVKSLEEVQQAKENALKDPFAFVEALQNGEINFQPRIKIVKVPDIDMSKYDISSYIESIRPNTRRSTKESSLTSHLLGGTKESTESTDIGSKPTKPKSATHNVYWTAEEQRRLEELLIKYPDEPIAAKRYAKIAKELGSRTLMQVQSRVQKYFIALKKEGLPVPGRDPKSAGLRYVPRKRNYASQTSASAKFMKAFDFEDPLSRGRGLKIETVSESMTHLNDTSKRRGVKIETDSDSLTWSTDTTNKRRGSKIEKPESMTHLNDMSKRRGLKIETTGESVAHPNKLSRRRGSKSATSKSKTDSINKITHVDKSKIKVEYKDESNSKMIEALQKLKKIKQQQIKHGDVIHVGYKCSGCQRQPILGIRWHCKICPPSVAVDLCGRCSKLFNTDRHRRKHTLKPFFNMDVKDALKYLMK